MRHLNIFKIAAAALVIVAASYAVPLMAGNTTFFSSIGDLVFPFSPPTTSPSAPGTIDNMTIGATTPAAGTFTTLSAAQVNSILGSYAKNPAAIASYASYQFASNQSAMLFSPSGTVSYAYVALNSAPIDGWESCLFSTQTITTLYLNAGAGQTLANAATTLLANTKVCYVYSLANTTWNRSQ